MTDGKRACVAAIAFIAITRRTSIAIYDYSRRKYINLGIRCSNQLFNIYDYDRSGYIGGYLPNLFDYVSGYHVQLTIKNRNFKGFDYETATFYNGHVNGRTIEIYDYERGQFYIYGM